MKIKNNGKKIVHIGVDALMPGDEIIADTRVADTPAIKILASHGILTITDDNTITAPKIETAPKTETAPVTPPAPAAPAADTNDTPGKKGSKKGVADPAVK